METPHLSPLPASRLGICSFSAGLARRPDLFARTGIGLEISDTAYARNLEPEPFDALRQSLQELRGSLRGFLGFHAPYRSMDPASPDPAIRRVTADRYRQVIALAREFSADYVVFHANYNPQWSTPAHDARFVDICAEFYADLQADAGGVSLILENMFEDTPERLLPLFERLDSGLGLLLDSGHLHVYSRVAPGEWLSRLSPWLCALHLNDNEGQMDQHNALGRGSFPLESFLSGARPHAPLTLVEVKNFGEVQASVAFLTGIRYVEDPGISS